MLIITFNTLVKIIKKYLIIYSFSLNNYRASKPQKKKLIFYPNKKPKSQDFCVSLLSILDFYGNTSVIHGPLPQPHTDQ